MKNLLTLVIVLTSATAFATRSRLNSLGNSPHLSDVGTVYSNPSDMTRYKDSLTLESGVNGGAAYVTDTNTLAEGLLIRSMGDAKIGFALGHKNALVILTAVNLTLTVLLALHLLIQSLNKIHSRSCMLGNLATWLGAWV